MYHTWTKTIHHFLHACAHICPRLASVIDKHTEPENMLNSDLLDSRPQLAVVLSGFELDIFFSLYHSGASNIFF